MVGVIGVDDRLPKALSLRMLMRSFEHPTIVPLLVNRKSSNVGPKWYTYISHSNACEEVSCLRCGSPERSRVNSKHSKILPSLTCLSSLGWIGSLKQMVWRWTEDLWVRWDSRGGEHPGNSDSDALPCSQNKKAMKAAWGDPSTVMPVVLTKPDLGSNMKRFFNAEEVEGHVL